MRDLLDIRPTYQRVLAVAIGVFLVTGCGDKHVAAPHQFRISLPWQPAAAIPREYTCDGADVAPVVRPAGRLTAVVMTDPDAPGGTFTHWTRWDGGVEGRNSFGSVGYRGPCPPRGDKPHRYVVTVYRLRHPLRLQRGASPGAVVAALARDTQASSAETGTYGR